MAKPLTAFAGGTLYADAMLLVSFLRPDSLQHRASRQLFQRVVDGTQPLRLVTATLTLDEVVFVLLQELLLDPPNGVTRSRSQYLSEHPDVVRELMRVIDPPIQGLTELLTLEPVLPEDIVAMRREMAATGLLPRDALHVAVMRRLGIAAIASDDDAFEGCAGITLFKP